MFRTNSNYLHIVAFLVGLDTFRHKSVLTRPSLLMFSVVQTSISVNTLNFPIDCGIAR